MKILIALVILLAGSLVGLDYYFKSLDNTLHPITELQNTQLPSDKAMQVLDPETGKLKVQGWAIYPNKLSYQPNLSKVYWPILSREKQWNYFYVRNDDWLVTMAHANVGVVKSSYINVLKIGGNYEVTESIIEDYFGNYVFFDVNKNGNGIYSVCEHPDLTMKFIKPEGDNEVKISAHSEQGSHSMTVDLTGINWSEGITHIENQTPEGDFHSFNTKALVDFLGTIKVNGTDIIKCTEKNPCMGLHDNGRTIGKYMNTWTWGSLVFKAPAKTRTKKEKKIGLNLSLSEETQNSSGDVLWVDDKLYKIDSLSIEKISPTEWHITSNTYKGQKHPKNKVDITFKVGDRHSIVRNYVLINIDFNSNFGFFSGTVEAQGKKITFEDQFGFVEEMFSRW